MKKCSHSAHETMTELNITPLLDLAFVLLVIFIITTTPIVNDLDLNLPAVKSRLHRARLMMRDLLAPHFEEKYA